MWRSALRAEECDRILDVDMKRFGPTGVQTTDDGGPVGDGQRSATGLSLGLDCDWLYARMLPFVQEVNAIFDFDIAGYAAPQLLRYQAGQQYSWHVDIGQGDLATRKLSIIALLSHDSAYEGGELDWMPDLGPIPTARGTLIVFPSFMPHRVRLVTRGERLAMVTWVHGDRPYR